MRRATIVALALTIAFPVTARGDRLRSLVGDRVAGDAVDCIEVANIDEVHIVPGVGFVYVMRTGGLVYLNRVAGGATFVHDGVLPIIERAAPRLCSVEPVRLYNENSRLPLGSVTLGRFVPYRRP